MALRAGRFGANILQVDDSSNRPRLVLQQLTATAVVITIYHQLPLDLSIRKRFPLKLADSPCASLIEKHQTGAVKNQAITLIVEKQDFLSRFDYAPQNASGFLITIVSESAPQ